MLSPYMDYCHYSKVLAIESYFSINIANQKLTDYNSTGQVFDNGHIILTSFSYFN